MKQSICAPEDKNEKMICILLSTFNGANYLSAQLDSLLNQTCQEWTLMVRDDGSHDCTLEILDDYAQRDSRITILPRGESLGAAGSYLTLLLAAPEADYYAFCDQDDVWLPDKLTRSIQALAGLMDSPAMYCSSLFLVDRNLNPLGRSRRHSRGPSFENALIQNIATGCTLTLNVAAVRLIRKRMPLTNRIVMHDWWCYLVISAFGHVIFDPSPTLYYRQHEENQIGELPGISFWRNRFRRFCLKSEKGLLTRQVSEFFSCWSIFLPMKKAVYLERVIQVMVEKKVVRRFCLLMVMRLQRQTILDTLLFRLLLLFGYYHATDSIARARPENPDGRDKFVSDLEMRSFSLWQENQDIKQRHTPVGCTSETED